MEDCRGELEERREVTRNANPIRTVMQVAHYAPNKHATGGREASFVCIPRDVKSRVVV